MRNYLKPTCLTVIFMLFIGSLVFAQNMYVKKFENSSIFAGIEVGSKGVKMSLVEVEKNDQRNGTFNILKDTSINTDFISFTQATYTATLNALNKLYDVAIKDCHIPDGNVFTAVSSGVRSRLKKKIK